MIPLVYVAYIFDIRFYNYKDYLYAVIGANLDYIYLNKYCILLIFTI